MKLSQTIQTSDGVLVPAGVNLEFSGGKAKYQGHPIERKLVPLEAIVGAKGPFLRACCATVINDCRRFQSDVRTTNYQDWAHCIVDGDNIIVYVWDTRQVIDVIPGLHAGAAGGPITRTRKLVNKQTGEQTTKTEVLGHNKWGWAKSFYEMLMLPQYHRLDNGLPLTTDNKDWQAAIANVNKQAAKAQAAYESFDESKRAEYAEQGLALADGSYPITDVDDLLNAIQAYGRAKDKELVKQHIIKRATELNAVDKLPESWTGTELFLGTNGNGVFIFRYAEIESWFRKCKLPKAEPWMHIAITTVTKNDYGAVVYIWDTRKVVAECKLDEKLAKDVIDAGIRTRSGAIDNGRKLVGGGNYAALANRIFR